MKNAQDDLAAATLLVNVSFLAGPTITDDPEGLRDDGIADHTDRMLGQVQIEDDLPRRFFVAA